MSTRFESWRLHSALPEAHTAIAQRDVPQSSQCAVLEVEEHRALLMQRSVAHDQLIVPIEQLKIPLWTATTCGGKHWISRHEGW